MVGSDELVYDDVEDDIGQNEEQNGNIFDTFI